MSLSGVVGHYFKSSSPKKGVTGLTDAQNEPKSFFFVFFGVTNHSFDPLLTQRLIHHTPPFAEKPAQQNMFISSLCASKNANTGRIF